MALQCVPFVMPEHWAVGGICEDLPGYTIHAEQSMRQVGGWVGMGCVMCMLGCAGLQPDGCCNSLLQVVLTACG